jgi:hypothetical protein
VFQFEYIEVFRYMGEFNLLTLILSSVTGFLTFVLGQQRGKKEVESVHLQNLEKSIEIYKTIIDDLRDEISILNDRVETLQGMVNELMVENHKLQRMIEK